jgi:hypothetical protein
MLVIYVLYSIAYWNILAVLLCSSSSISNPCIDPSVLNLGVFALELVFEDFKLLCEFQISAKMFIPRAELGLKGSVPL